MFKFIEMGLDLNDERLYEPEYIEDYTFDYRSDLSESEDSDYDSDYENPVIREIKQPIIHFTNNCNLVKKMLEWGIDMNKNVYCNMNGVDLRKRLIMEIWN